MLITEQAPSRSAVAAARTEVIDSSRQRGVVSSRASSACPSRSWAATALRLGACSVINIKPARVGGYLAARAIHDLCAAQGIPVWCGGMLETGVGRAANLALAALENFTLPGDVSATARYFAEDITRAFVLEDGYIAVPTGPGTGVDILRDVLGRLTIRHEILR